MKSLLLFSFVLFFGSASHAQQVHFIYLQTDNKQPFYVRINEKLYSSSAAGYLVIPKLNQGTHSLSVGFPKNEWPSQTLNVQVADKDLGFLLKNFENNKWGLFNFQTMEVVTVANEKNSGAVAASAKTDQFSNILADVVNTPSIREEKREVLNSAPPANVAKTAEAPAVPAPAEASPVPTVQLNTNVVTQTDIRKLSSTTDKDGTVTVYADKLTDGTDTIKIFIEATNAVFSNAAKEKDVVAAENVQIEKKPEAVEVVTEASPKFIAITLANPNEPTKATGTQKDGVVLAPTATGTTAAALKPLTINSDCKELASDADFLKIRKKMTAENDDDAMVKVAVKLFKQKCYSTDQVKNLSVLFLKDEGKYKLFDAAYPYIHDTQAFRQLESQLTDAYIITRFRAMIRN